MPRALWLIIAAGVLVWAAAFLRVDEPARRPAARPEPEAAEPAVQAAQDPAPRPVAPVAPVATTAKQPEPPAAVATAPRVQRAGGLLANATASWLAARDALVGRTPGPPAPVEPAPGEVATGELGDGILSPAYAALERAYVYEPRDGEWAAGEERELRALLQGVRIGQLAIVNCQQTICRVVFEQAPENAFQQLTQVRGLADRTHVSSATPYSYRSGQLSVYFPRRSALRLGGGP